MSKHNFRQLTIWKDSMILAKTVYRLTQTLPSEHKFGLSSQLYRSAVSVPSNIAEGTSRSSVKEFVRFLQISLGSAYELETQLTIAFDCELLPLQDFEELSESIQKLEKQIVAFIRSVEN